jgi:hypothetical protein
VTGGCPVMPAAPCGDRKSKVSTLMVENGGHK